MHGQTSTLATISNGKNLLQMMWSGVPELVGVPEPEAYARKVLLVIFAIFGIVPGV